MAKVYKDQGNLSQAAEIYKYLLEREPGQQDLLNALSEIEQQQRGKDLNDLNTLFSRWMDLLLEYHAIRKLERLQRFLDEDK